jgi:SH3-like domain-containing protein
MPRNRVWALSLAWLVFLASLAFAQEEGFQVKVNSDNINIRADATVNSASICTVNKDDTLQAVAERYGEWYKVKLPPNAPAYVNRALVVPQDAKTLRVIKFGVNIRLEPNEKSLIIARVNIGQLLNLVKDEGEWAKVEPPPGSFGWIHKKFADSLAPKPEKKAAQNTPAQSDPNVYEGTLEPYGRGVKYTAALKFTAADGKTFLLTGDRRSLENLSYHRVRITAMKIVEQRQGYPVIYPQKIEVLD